MGEFKRVKEKKSEKNQTINIKCIRLKIKLNSPQHISGDRFYVFVTTFICVLHMGMMQHG